MEGSRKKRRIPRWVALIFIVPLLPLVFAGGLWLYMAATATPLHPVAEDVPSVRKSDASSKWAAATEQARQIVRGEVATQNLPGLSVAVGTGGDIIWAEGFGWANIEEREPVTPDLRFRFGNGSIVLTSIAAGLLIDQGKLNLDAEIQTYVPDFPKREWTVTLRQLMAHTSGLGTDDGDEGPFGEHCERPVEGLKLFKDRPLRFEPGSQYRFSSFGWILVSAAVEAAAGESIYRFMEDRIFEPLGMNDTKPDSRTDPIPNRVTFYFPQFAADNRYGFQFAPDVDYSCYGGAFIFLSTPSDLVRFGMAIDSGKLLQPATIKLLQTPQSVSSGEQTGYGLGWDVETITLLGRQTRVVGHDGAAIGGKTASLWSFPEHGLVVSVMTNTSWFDTFQLAQKVAQAFAAIQNR